MVFLMSIGMAPLWNDKNEVLKELSCFDKKRPVQDQKRLDKYRLYQAYLGSK